MSMSHPKLDPATGYVHFGSKSIRLTRIEFELLRQLLGRHGRLAARQELLAAVWGGKVSVEVRTVDSHMVRLRRKLNQLGAAGLAIETVWGLGYRVITADDLNSK